MLDLFCTKLGVAVLPPDWFKPCPPSEETTPGPDPFIGDLPFLCMSNKYFLATPVQTLHPIPTIVPELPLPNATLPPSTAVSGRKLDFSPVICLEQ